MANELLREAMLSDIESIAELNGKPGVLVSRREMHDTIVVVARFWFAPTRGAEWRFFIDGHVTHFNWESSTAGEHWTSNSFFQVLGHEEGFWFDCPSFDETLDAIPEPFEAPEAFVRQTLAEAGVL